MNKNFEETLPKNYKEVFHIDAKEKKTGLCLNLLALGITAIIIAIALAIPFFIADYTLDLNSASILHWLCLIILLIVYLVFHELVHGVGYKLLTKQKLTFGLS